MPPFDLSASGGIGLVLARGVADATLALCLGTTVLRSVLLPRALPAPAERAASAAALRRIAQGSALFAAAWLVLWLILVGRDLAGARSLSDTMAAADIMLEQTRFGAITCAQLGALGLLFAASLFESRWAKGLSLAAAVAAMGLQACHGHAFSMGNPGLFLAALLHVLAAGAWIGSLPGLLVVGWRLPPGDLGRLCRAYSPFGGGAVLVLGVCALIQGLMLIGSWPGLFTTAYGWVALFKAALLLTLLAVAGFHLLIATPALARGQEDARRRFLKSLSLEILLGLLVLLAAGLLGSLAPALQI